MPRRTNRFTGKRRILAAAATLLAFGGIVTVTQVSEAGTRPGGLRAAYGCDRPEASPSAVESGETRWRVCPSSSPGASASSSAPAGQSASPSPSDSTSGAPGAGLGVLANSCVSSTLPQHDGFQHGDRCVSTEFGEVGTAANNPSLLITSAPRSVVVGAPFVLRVSTRNLVRDRFLAAAKGGYYVESSLLADGILRGHFHTACRMLTGRDAAPAPDPVPAFFKATEDGKGGREPDTVTIEVPGLPQPGLAQCASWAGDGSHRVPMMERANQTPAFDAVRIVVRRR